MSISIPYEDYEDYESTPEDVEKLVALGWDYELDFLYDEEGIEGWAWTSPGPEYLEYSIIGSHDRCPEIPEAGFDALQILAGPQLGHQNREVDTHEKA